MKVHLNGAEMELPSPMSLSNLLIRLKLKVETVVVEHNLEVPLKPNYGEILIQDGDRIEIVKFMGGG